MQTEQVKYLTVEPDQDGQRIDNYLLRYYRMIPKSRIYRAIRKGEVRVNKKRTKATYRVVSGDYIRIPPLRKPEVVQTEVTIDEKKRIKQAVIFEDDELLILDKPNGIAVHGGSAISFGIIETLRQCYPKHQYLELIHRLDRDTSGILLIAKKPKILRECHALLRAGKMDKQYLLLVQGQWPKTLTEVNAPLKKNILISNERIVTVDDSGKPALTEFKIVEAYQEATLLSARLRTGRTHQLRVHTAHVGHPIIGDEKYGKHQVNQDYRTLGLKRLFLHAESIQFQLTDHKPYHFVAHLPGALAHILHKLDNI